MLWLISFLALQAQALEGYPKTELVVEAKPQVQIRNDHCFPVVVSWEDKIFDVPAKATRKLNEKSWGAWHWVPGSRGATTSRSVLHPLREKKRVDHGPGSGWTHEGLKHFAYDFFIPEGSPVLAMEDGIVARVVDRFVESHQDKNRMDEVNVVEVVSADGAIATYAHLKPRSTHLTPCQSVRAGETIGLSGNTGYSAAPHLHVDVKRPLDGKRLQSIELTFR